MDYIAKIKFYMDQQNLSQNKLSKLAGVSQGVISDILTGRNKAPSLPTLEKLCSALGITLPEFFAEDSESNPKEQELLGAFRALDDEKQDTAIRLVKTL